MRHTDVTILFLLRMLCALARIDEILLKKHSEGRRRAIKCTDFNIL
jgi:hypothetical protein